MITAKTKLFLILWLAGMAGVLSILLIDISAILANLPAATRSGQPLPPPALLKLISIIQPTILLSLAVFIGTQLAAKVGLSAPAAEAMARGKSFLEALKPQVIPGLIAGLFSGIAILLSYVLFRPFLPPLFVTRAERLNYATPVLTRFLYGGITEELLLRWGLMTLLIWLTWRILQAGRGNPKSSYIVAAILVSAIVFGVAHLPIAVALDVELTVAIVTFVVFANSLFGLVAGFLYWRKGLEAAIIAHITTHVVLVTAICLAL
jgi:Type II CAAX prenyl endopeptidase Rce1-like